MRRLLSIALLASLAGNAAAHEIGTTTVRVLLNRDHNWTVELTTAPFSLMNKLEARGRLPRSPAGDERTTRHGLETLLPELGRAIDLRFDGRPAPILPAIATLTMPVDSARPAFVVVRAVGPIPRQARNLTFRYGLAYSTYALTIGTEGEPSLTQWVEADETSHPFAVSSVVLPPTGSAVVRQYLQLGFQHIIPYGLDHILFVLGIFLFTTRLKPILAQVTAFTVAHSITLGLTMYGLVSLPSRVVEPLIAVSIAYVAIENILTTELKPWRVAVVFCFGLLHGMGFAGVLRELGLPRSEFVTALVSFNIGVELAQLTVIGVAFLVIASWSGKKPWYRQRVVIPASMAIAATGIFWTLQRIMS